MTVHPLPIHILATSPDKDSKFVYAEDINITKSKLIVEGYTEFHIFQKVGYESLTDSPREDN